MADKLTPKQEAFCVAVVSGNKYVDAYRLAFNVKSKNRACTYVSASQLMALPKVHRRVQELQAAITNAFIAMQVERLLR